MKDLNFFEPYIERREIKLNKSLFLYAMIMFGILSILAYGIYNQIQINSLNKVVSSLKEIAENPKTVEKVNEIKEKQNEVNTFKEEVEKIKKMDKAIEDVDIIDEDLLRFITSKMPEDLFFTNLSVYNREIQISGISKDKWSIAELKKGLEEIENVDDMFISNITSEDDHYKFNLNITLKEVSEVGK